MTTAAPSSPLRTVEEAADYLRVSRATLFRLLGSGELASLKIRDRTFVHQDAIDDFLIRRAGAVP